MSGFLYSAAGFLIVIGILVTVHEFGHFWVARRLGVKVLRFSIGFGKPLYTWRRKGDDTEYQLAIIPLGGYVKMLDENEGEVPPEERERAFNRQPLGVRSAIVAAGPMSNFLFAVLAIWLAFGIGVDDMEPVVGKVTPASIAERSGFEPGDRLLEIDGKPVKTWGQYQLYLFHRALQGREVAFVVRDADGGERAVRVDFGALERGQVDQQVMQSGIGLWPKLPPAEISGVVPGSPAERAGLREGDRVLSVDGEATPDWVALVKAVAAKPGENLLLEVLRDGRRMTVEVQAGRAVVGEREIGRIGIYPPRHSGVKLRYGPLEGFWRAIEYNWQISAVTLRSLAKMVTAEISTESISGPITIARYAGYSVQSGGVELLRFLAIISVSLGLLNLLPIPLLDGGHLLFYAIEAVKGSPLSERAMMLGQQLGILLLALLMSLAFYNDIIRFFS